MTAADPYGYDTNSSMPVEEYQPEITADYLVVTCNGRHQHRRRIIAALLPLFIDRGAGGFLAHAYFGQDGLSVRETRPGPGYHDPVIKFRFRCRGCGRDTQLSSGRLQELFFQLVEERDRLQEAATGPNGSTRLELSALPF